MPRKTAYELVQNLSDPETTSRLARALALSGLLGQSIVDDDYEVPDDLVAGITLSTEGEKWLEKLREKFPGSAIEELTLAVFVVFAWHEPLVNVQDFSPEIMEAALSREIRGQLIRFPWNLGRSLHNRYTDMFGGWRAELSPGESREFLAGTPQGVFQLYDLVTGPFGLLKSEELRVLPPDRTAAILHCSDPSCGGLHAVDLNTGATHVSEAVRLIQSEYMTSVGPPSDWEGLTYRIIYGDRYYDDQHPGNLPRFLGNAFSERELRELFRWLLDTRAESMRSHLPSNQFERLRGSSSEIANSLIQPELLQLVLTIRDVDLVETLEQLIDRADIHIPSTETRRYVVGPRERYGAYAIMCEGSAHGIRFVSPDRDLAMVRLLRLLRDVYSEEGDDEQLAWRLRHLGRLSLERRLIQYIFQNNPEDVLEQLIFIAPRRLRRTFELLRFGSFELPEDREAESRLLRKIVWKLGFQTTELPTYLPTFWKRLSELREISSIGEEYTEQQQSLIRSTGVNFFVALEQVLDHTLCFATQSLLGDPYPPDRWARFRFQFSEARRYMSDLLTGRPIGRDETLVIDPGGRNSLFALTRGLEELGKLCSEVIARGQEYVRPNRELPGYVGKSALETFPFIHTAALFDITDESRVEIVATLADAAKRLDRSQVADVRNRIDHKREDFPSQSDIQRALDIVAEAVEHLEGAGIAPSVYHFKGRSTDRHGRSTQVLEDYRGRQHAIQANSPLRLSRLPAASLPQIVFRRAELKQGFDVLRYRLEEESDYSELWRGFAIGVRREPDSIAPPSGGPATGLAEEDVQRVDIPDVDTASA